MVGLQCGFIPDFRDKNAELAAAPAPTRLFDAEVVLEELFPGRTGEGRDAESIQVIVRWGEKTVDGREIVVVEVMNCHVDVAKRRARELSEGRVHGRRFWVLPLGRVPAGARYEVGTGDGDNCVSAAGSPSPASEG